MGILVKATRLGFFGGSLRREGDEFLVESKSQISDLWMQETSPVSASDEPLVQEEPLAEDPEPEEIVPKKRGR